MKTFIYFSQGEWRTFQAEELPVKPEFVNFMKVNFSHDKASYECALKKYESEIAALKAKSVKVGNINAFTWPPDFHERLIDLVGMKFYQWPGTVEVKKVQHCDEYHQHTKKSCYLSEAILKLPDTL